MRRFAVALPFSLCVALPFTHQTDRVAPKASTCQHLIGYINTCGKKYDDFYVCCYDFSQCRKSLYNTAVYVINGE